MSLIVTPRHGRIWAHVFHQPQTPPSHVTPLNLSIVSHITKHRHGNNSSLSPHVSVAFCDAGSVLKALADDACARSHLEAHCPEYTLCTWDCISDAIATEKLTASCSSLTCEFLFRHAGCFPSKTARFSPLEGTAASRAQCLSPCKNVFTWLYNPKECQ